MKSYRQIVKDTGSVLKEHELGKKPKVMSLWQQVQWQEVPRNEEGRIANLIPDTSSPVIALYPALLQSESPVFEVLKAFGNLILSVAGSRAAHVWEAKLCLPTPAQIEIVRGKLQDPDIRRHCRRYEDILHTYPEKGSAADRLVLIHITNALLANNIPFEDSEGVDIQSWGPTAEYCAFKRYHSLIPLVTHYCPPEVSEDYGMAFAHTVLSGHPPCWDSSVRTALAVLIKAVVSRLEPYPEVG